MKLIDVGCFNGDSVLHFVAYREIDAIEAYDPNNEYFDIWEAIKRKYPYVTFHNKAVSNFNGDAMYTKRPMATPLGSSISPEKHDFGLGEMYKIPTVDISDIVSDGCWVKLDGEGEEFRILQKLIDDDKLKMVSKIFLEWHTNKMANNPKKIDFDKWQKDIESEIAKYNIEVRNW